MIAGTQHNSLMANIYVLSRILNTSYDVGALELASNTVRKQYGSSVVLRLLRDIVWDFQRTCLSSRLSIRRMLLFIEVGLATVSVFNIIGKRTRYLRVPAMQSSIPRTPKAGPHSR